LNNSLKAFCWLRPLEYSPFNRGLISASREVSPRDQSSALGVIMKKLPMFLSLLLPWEMRRAILGKQFNYRIHSTCRIGFSWTLPTRLIMEEGSRIERSTLCKNIDLLHLKAYSLIGRGNWITDFPLDPSQHFAQEKGRPQLILGQHSAIAHRQIIDCTNTLTIGRLRCLAR
jgi:hypothetical protein